MITIMAYKIMATVLQIIEALSSTNKEQQSTYLPVEYIIFLTCANIPVQSNVCIYKVARSCVIGRK